MESRGFTRENGRILVSLRDGPYKGRTPGDRPELMPLDCHLFADFKSRRAGATRCGGLARSAGPLRTACGR